MLTVQLDEEQQLLVRNLLDGALENAKAHDALKGYVNLWYQFIGPIAYEDPIRDADDVDQLRDLVNWFLDDFSGKQTKFRDRFGQLSWDEAAEEFYDRSLSQDDDEGYAAYRAAANVMHTAASMWDTFMGKHDDE